MYIFLVVLALICMLIGWLTKMEKSVGVIMLQSKYRWLRAQVTNEPCYIFILFVNAIIRKEHNKKHGSFATSI